MKLIAPLLLSVLLSQAAPASQGAAPAAPAPRELIVVVSVPTYLPDGSVNAETVTLPTAGAGLIHAFSRRTLCAPATTGATEPSDAAAGWRIASQIVTRSETDVVVSLDWRRVWDGGRKITNGPGATVQLTLHAGDRIPLDLIANSAPTAECRAVGLGLEVRVARTPPSAPAATPTNVPIGSTPGGAKPVSAELWFTHTSPTSDTTQVYRQVVRIAEAGGRFSFAPTSVSTSRGDINVELTGTIERFRSPEGSEFFVLSMNRVVSGANLPADGLSATTGTVVPMPTASEVVAFELIASGGRARGGGGGGGGAGGAVLAPRGGGVGGGGSGRGGAVAGVGAVRGGGAGAAGTTPPPATVQGGRGGGRAGSGSVSPAVLAAMLEGHQFSLRMRVTPLN